jgi:hypothetical protein
MAVTGSPHFKGKLRYSRQILWTTSGGRDRHIPQYSVMFSSAYGFHGPVSWNVIHKARPARGPEQLVAWVPGCGAAGSFKPLPRKGKLLITRALEVNQQHPARKLQLSNENGADNLRWQHSPPRCAHSMPCTDRADAGVYRKRPCVVTGCAGASAERPAAFPQCASTASNSSATMLVILIIGFTAGPAVSL